MSANQEPTGRQILLNMGLLLLLVIGLSLCMSLAANHFNNPKRIMVCETDPKKFIIIPEDDFNPNVYSKNLNDCE